MQSSDIAERLRPRPGITLFLNKNTGKKGDLYLPDTVEDSMGVSWVDAISCPGCDVGQKVLVRWSESELITRGEYGIPTDMEFLVFKDGMGVFVTKDGETYRAILDSIIIKRDEIVEKEGSLHLPDKSRYRNGQCEIVSIGPDVELECEVGQRWTYKRAAVTPIDADYGVVKPEHLYFEICS